MTEQKKTHRVRTIGTNVGQVYREAVEAKKAQQGKGAAAAMALMAKGKAA